jgi:hypothetical protein
MTKVCSRLSDFYKVQAILVNRLSNLWVSHEEVYTADERDGDLVGEFGDSIMLITGLIDEKVEPGCFLDSENKSPRIIIHKDVVVSVQEDEI